MVLLGIFAIQDSFGTACNVTADSALTLILTGYCECSAFTVIFQTNAGTSPLAGQPVLMHKNSHAPILSCMVAQLNSARKFNQELVRRYIVHSPNWTGG